MIVEIRRLWIPARKKHQWNWTCYYHNMGKLSSSHSEALKSAESHFNQVGHANAPR